MSLIQKYLTGQIDMEFIFAYKHNKKKSLFKPLKDKQAEGRT